MHTSKTVEMMNIRLFGAANKRPLYRIRMMNMAVIIRIMTAVIGFEQQVHEISTRLTQPRIKAKSFDKDLHIMMTIGPLGLISLNQTREKSMMLMSSC